jgi:hypothetical protein
MLDNFRALFNANGIQCTTAVMKTIGDLIGFLEQQFQGDTAKVNEGIDHIKNIIDSHKK